MAVVWASTLAVSLGLGIFLERRGAVEMARNLPIDNADVVVIGTSLVRNGFPIAAVDGGLLRDGEAHKRFAETMMREARVIELGEYAIQSGAKRIFLEVNPFTFDFGGALEGQVRHQTGFPHVVTVLDRLSAGLKSVAGTYKPRIIMDDNADMTLRFDGDPAEAQLPYALVPRQPRRVEDMDALVALAREKDVDLILMSFPRSKAVEPQIKPDISAALVELQDALSKKYGLPLFRTDPFWPNEMFLDPTHLNAEGRARYLSELNDWLAARP